MHAQNNKLVAFELYRAAAVMMVVIGHFVNDSKGMPFIAKEIANSFVLYGVPLFFIISGFLLSASFMSIQRTKVSLLPTINQFLIKRVLRIYPAYVASLVILSLLYGSDFMDFIAHLFNIHNFFEDYNRSINAVYWSLAVEFQWYLIAPLAILLFSKTNYKMHIIILLAAISLSAFMRWDIISDFFNKQTSMGEVMRLGQDQVYIHLFNFFIGIMIYQWRNIQLNIHPLGKFVLLFSLVAIGYYEYDIAVQISLYNHEANYQLLALYVSALLLGAVVFVFLDIDIKHNYYKVISFISLISYSLYIYHYPVLYFVNSFDFMWYINLPVYALLSFILATASYHLIEAPFLHEKKKNNITKACSSD